MLHDMPLDELREARAMSQEHLAKILRVHRSAVSKMERRADMYISTLQDFVPAMGGHLVEGRREGVVEQPLGLSAHRLWLGARRLELRDQCGSRARVRRAAPRGQRPAWRPRHSSRRVTAEALRASPPAARRARGSERDLQDDPGAPSRVS
jgi:hypothetical protein